MYKFVSNYNLILFLLSERQWLVGSSESQSLQIFPTAIPGVRQVLLVIEPWRVRYIVDLYLFDLWS